MVLWLIGLGLGDAGDITVKGLDAVRKSKHVYLEAYTSVLPGLDRAALAEAYGPLPLLDGGEFIEADRELVESGCDEMLERSKEDHVSFLVVGDALCATTHTDLWLRAKKLGIDVRVVHNASVMNAIAACGLQLYRFGETVSIPYWIDSWKPDSFYDKLVANRKANLHTLCLLDIKVKEQTLENMMRGRKVYEPPRFMTVAQALSQLMEIESYKKEGVAGEDSTVIGVARLGREDQAMTYGKCREVIDVDLGGPLHSLVIPAEELHELELEFLDFYKCGAEATG
jgi:diphthine synthase